MANTHAQQTQNANIRSLLERGKRRQTSDISAKGLTVTLGLAFRIQQRKEYTFADAQREFGMSLRSYRRHLARMRYAGIILHTDFSHDHGVGWVRYIGFDVMMTEEARVT